MPGFLLEDDAVEARKNIFDSWLDEQKKKAEDAAVAAQQTATSALGTVSGAAQQLSAEAQQRKQEFDNWLASQQPQQTPATAPVSQPAPAQPTPTPTPTSFPQLSAPATPEAQQRSNAFDDWLTQRQQDVQNVTQAIQGVANQAPALPHSEEPATATDQVRTGPDLGSRWKTQFDFGATYSGNYRTGTPHRGVDLVPSSGSGIGTEVDAFAPGKVTNISRDSGAGGLMVYVQDDQGLTHAYMHLDHVAPGLAVGQTVQRGQPIAAMGESGTEGSPHLHYEVRKNAATGDPLDQLIDPRPYIAGGGGGQRMAGQSATKTTAELSGGGSSGGLTDRAQQILSGAADLARAYGEDAARAVQSVLVTEGGLNNARGDNGQSAGPLQFFSGGPGNPGQLDNFARAFGMGIEQAKQWIEEHPLAAVQWALGTPDNPGYLGRAIQAGQAAGARGADLATFIQKNGQVSVSPERAGDNFRSLFGGVSGSILDTLGQGAQSVAQRAADLERSSGELVRSTGQGMQDAMSQLEQTRARIAAENERYDQEQRAKRNAQLADIMQTRRFELPDTGFAAPDTSGIRNALEPLNQPPLAEGSPLRQQLDELLRPKYQQNIEQGRRALEQGYGVPGGMLSGEQLAMLGGARADEQIGQDNAKNVVAKAKDAGWNPDQRTEDIATSVLSQLTPINIASTLIGGPEVGTVRSIAEGAAFLGLSLLGQAGGEAIAPSLPEGIRPFAGLIGGFAAPVVGPMALRGVARGVRTPGAQQFLRDERGELTIPGRRPESEPPPAVETQRMYHGTSGDFTRPDPRQFEEEGLYGPGYYLTNDPRVAGGVIARGGEPMESFGLGPRRTYAPGEVIESGYAQQNPLATSETLDLGANVRPVDVPRDMALLDMDRYVDPQDVANIRSLLAESASPTIAARRLDVFDRVVEGAFEGRPTGQRVYDALNRAYGNTRGSKTFVNNLLTDAGFEGVSHQGGRINPMRDPVTGQDIQHQVNVIFPEALDRITNAVSGTRGGLLPETGGVSPGIAGQLGRRAVGTVGGAAAGYATAPEGATEEERRQRAAVGAGVGLGLATGLEGMGLVGRGPMRAIAPGELRPATAAGERGSAFAAAARLADQAASEEAAAEKVFTGPIADALERIGQQPVSRAEVDDAARTLASLRAVGDRVTGVPQQFSSPEGLAQLRARLRVLAEQGISQKDWYSDSSRKILEATQYDRQAAERLAQLVAIYSPNTPVDANLNNALMAWSQWKAGVDPADFKVAMGAQDQRAIDLLYHGQPWEGRKTNNFYRNLMQHIDPKVYEQLGKETGQSGVTADIWMMRAFDYLAGPNQEGRRWLKAPSEAQYDFIQDEVTRLGKELGWTPEQVQAAVWSSTKAAAEGTGIVEAGFHYGSALERRMAQVSYTASPGSAEMQRVPGYMDAPEHERSAYNLASESGFIDPVTGRDQAAEAAGLMRGRTLDVPEVYGEYVGPGLQAEVPAPAARGSRTEPVFTETGERLRDAEGKLVSKSIPIREAAGLVFAPARNALNAFAAFRGKVLKQDAVPWTRMFFSNAAARDANLNQVHIGRPLTTDEAQQLNQALIEQLGGDGKHAVVATADGAWILNLQGEFMRRPNAPNRVVTGERPIIDPETGKSMRDPENPRRVLKERTTREENVVGTWLPSLDEAGKPLPFADNPSFNKAVEEAVAKVELSGDPDAHVSPFRADGEYVFNDWSEHPNGEGYQSQIESSGRAEAFAAVEAAITRRVRKAQADIAERFGWPPDPNNPFSRAGAEPRVAGAAEPGLPGAAEPAAAGVGPRAPPEAAPEGAGFTAPGGEAPPGLPTSEGADVRSRLRDMLGVREPARADPMFAARLGGAVAGVAGSEATMSDEDKQDVWGRISRDLGFGLAGMAAPGVGRAIASRGGPANWQDLRQLHVSQQPLLNAPQRQTAAQFLSAFTKNNLLSGPGTQVSNIFSQLIELARQPLERAAAGFEDEAVAGVKAAGQAIPDALRNAIDTMRTGRGRFQPPPGVQHTPAYWFALRALGAADDFFRTLGYAMGSGMEGQRFIRENPGQTVQQVLQRNQAAIDQAGQKTARLSVFAEGNGPGQAISDLKQRLMGGTAAQQVAGMALDAGVPFSSVPGRIWTAGLQRLPGAAEIAALAKAGLAVSKNDPRAAQLAMGAGLVSSVINTSIISNIMNGNITGPDDKEHPTSIKINGQWVDYSRWGPYMLPIALPAAWVEAARKEGNKPSPDQVKAFYNATFKTMANQFYAADLIKVMSQVGEGNAAGATGQLVGSYIDRYLPAGAALNFANQAWDPIMRDTSNRGLAQFWEREQAKIPGLAQLLPMQPSMTSGEPEQRLRSGLGGTLLGMQTRRVSDIDAEVNRLEKLGYTIPNPTRPPTEVSVQGARIALNEAEQRELAFQRGQAIDRVLTPLVTSAAFQSLSDDQKARAIASRLNNVDNDTARNWERMTPAAERSARIREGRTVVGRREPAVVGR